MDALDGKDSAPGRNTDSPLGGIRSCSSGNATHSAAADASLADSPERLVCGFLFYLIILS
jgi:hypothetical protein